MNTKLNLNTRNAKKEKKEQSLKTEETQNSIHRHTHMLPLMEQFSI